MQVNLLQPKTWYTFKDLLIYTFWLLLPPFSIYKVAGPLSSALVVGQKLKNVALCHNYIVVLWGGGGGVEFKALFFFCIIQFCSKSSNSLTKRVIHV